MLCEKFGLNPLADGVILSHREGHTRGIASNHGDLEYLWRGLGMSYTMDGFRRDVKAKMGGTAAPSAKFPAVPFSVKVIIDDLNYRSAPSMNGKVNGQTGKGTFTIVEVRDGWGRLKSGAGWIYLENPSYCTIGNTSSSATKTTKKSVDTLAREVIQGKWGNGADRKNRLTAAGYNYSAVQKRVNELLK